MKYVNVQHLSINYIAVVKSLDTASKLPFSRLRTHVSSMAESSGHLFTPRNPPNLEPPQNDPISVAELAKCDGAA